MQENTRVNILLNNQQLVLVTPEVEIHKQLSEHTKLMLKGIVKAESYSILEQIDSETQICVQFGKEKQNWFIGVVTYVDNKIQIHEERSYQELYLEAMSGTCLLEQQRKTVSYQKKSMSYQELIHLVIQDSRNSSFLMAEEGKGQILNRFVVQYEETDWNFLKRVASFMGLPLVASHTSAGAKFSVGVMWKNKDHVITEEEEWQMEVVQGSSFLESEGGEKEQGYQIQLKWYRDNPEAEPLEIGDSVIYQGARYYVKAARVDIADHQVKQECLLSGKRGFSVKEKQNTALTGLSLGGCVKEVRNNELQISLDVDAHSEQECWFAYSTFYSTFYCMPEKGDRINLYFPDTQENHAFVLNSVRSNPQQIVGSYSAAESHRDGGNGMTGGNSTQKAETSSEEEKISIVDVTPYLAMLSAPENGKLVNANVIMSDLPTSGGNYGGGSIATNEKMPTQGGRHIQINNPLSQVKKPSRTSYDFDSMAQNEKIKMLCTKGGKMVILNDEEGCVSIVCDDGTYIALKENGISIVTNQKITFMAEQDIRLKAGKEIVLMAEEKLILGCQEAGIVITPEMIQILGGDILLNREE